MSELPNLLPALPEIFIAVSALALLVAGVYSRKDATNGVGIFAIIVLLVAAILLTGQTAGKVVTFNGLFAVDAFTSFSKVLVLLASGLSLGMALNWLGQEKLGRFEFPVLVLFATLGMLMMISANSLLSLYMGLELQSLSLYVLAAYHRDNAKATEAGLKYFVLGSLASCLLLYGVSLVYGFAGTVSFAGLATALEHGAHNTGVTVGLVFILAGLAFKISAVPFHMWTPDVYEGAPTPVTAFFAVAPKIAAFSLLIRLLVGPFGSLVAQWQQIIILVAIGSLVVGAFAAINQTNIKRMLAYSSIGHVGFALVGLAAGGEEGIRGVLVYLAIYLFMNLGTFAIVLSMRLKGRALEGISDLAGLSKTHPGMALALTIFMFSMAGVPPLAGFWGKLYVFLAAMNQGLIVLSIIGVLSSVVSAFYYLRVIKVMYFDEVTDPLDQRVGTGLSVVMLVNAVLIVVFTLVPSQLINWASFAAHALIGG